MALPFDEELERLARLASEQEQARHTRPPGTRPRGNPSAWRDASPALKHALNDLRGGYPLATQLVAGISPSANPGMNELLGPGVKWDDLIDEIRYLNQLSLEGLPDDVPLVRGGNFEPGKESNYGHRIMPKYPLPTTSVHDIAEDFSKSGGTGRLTEFMVPKDKIGLNVRALLPGYYPQEREFGVAPEVLQQHQVPKGTVPEIYGEVRGMPKRLTMLDDLGRVRLGMAGQIAAMGAGLAAEPLIRRIENPTAARAAQGALFGAGLGGARGAGIGALVGLIAPQIPGVRDLMGVE